MDENGCKWMNDDGDVEEGMKIGGDGSKWMVIDEGGW